MASLDTVPLTGPSVQSFTYTVGVPAGGVQSFTYISPSGVNSEASFVYTLQANSSYCWDPRAQRLLDNLGAPFIKGLASLLGGLFRTIARELSNCTEIVTLTKTGDARGTGNFGVEVRFEPINAVSSVQRVDSNGSILETYTVLGYSGRVVQVAGVTPPRQGDLLQVTYSYTHEGLEGRVTEALSELNLLTADGDYLDNWGALFGVRRARTGKYGTEQYGTPNRYGVPGTESDSDYSRRIVAQTTAQRNTKPAIVAAVQKVTGGNPYLVEWLGTTGHRGFIFRPSGTPAWTGAATEAATQNHLIWGQTARFINQSVVNGGAFVFEVWVPKNSGVTAGKLLTVVNAVKPAGSKAIIRFF